jgi:secondary thiamine-phosphate synthase enzyme
MIQAQADITIDTHGPGLYEFTDQVAAWVRAEPVSEGLLSLFIKHTSASLLIQENADPSVLLDLQEFFARLAPEAASYHHRSEGPDDMPAHIKAALTQSSVNIPVSGGKIALGTWQGIYVFEHRHQPHHRTVTVHYVGE